MASAAPSWPASILRDATFPAEGLALFGGPSKTDQERHDAEVCIETVSRSPLSGIAALRCWLGACGDAPGMASRAM